MTHPKDLETIPEFTQHDLAIRTDPKTIQIDRHGRFWELVQSFGKWFKTPFDASTLHE
jgi:hypothetical protein